MAESEEQRQVSTIYKVSILFIPKYAAIRNTYAFSYEHFCANLLRVLKVLLLNLIHLLSAFFIMSARLNPELAQEIVYNDVNSLYTSNFDSRKLTKFVIHGYIDGAGEAHISKWILDTKDNYLNLADVNVILVDYSFRAYITIYLQAIPDTVGKRVAEMLIFLNREGMSLDSVHLIGWSWGAQISGR